MFRSALVAALLLAAAPAPASAFIASNRLPVTADGADTFTVGYSGRARGDISFWCAAGEYANRVLGAAATAPIWRISPPPRRSGASITFSMNSAGAAGSTGLATVGGSGGSMTVAAARNQCVVERQLTQTRR